MSYRITITGKEKYILVELFGEITIDKVMATNSLLYNDPDFIKHPYAIWDFSESTIDHEIEKVAVFAQQILTERHFATPGKTAFITTDPKAEELTGPFIELVGELPIEIARFPNRISAVQWIESKVPSSI